jgi:hypothetical protein
MIGDKRGQGLSTSTIVLLILAVAVLVILVLGFTIGWSKFLPFLNTNNVQDIKTACATACSTESTFDFCTTPREVNDKVNTKFTDTCDKLANDAKYTVRNYAIAKCPTITCTAA